ncbi:hypothetical protein IYY11_04115 [Methylocystis sp. H62]|uniref:hypothetical protein n=1 Tax=Methylocystis sp. H62 TaxID=2785789 RepID=UPI0018C2EA89|nr:hypothetical protein [Methylocystis sp. H62]MBG0792619.1 hypothetical protein [Methylocystis sp. H62]
MRSSSGHQAHFPDLSRSRDWFRRNLAQLHTRFARRPEICVPAPVLSRKRILTYRARRLPTERHCRSPESSPQARICFDRQMDQTTALVLDHSRLQSRKASAGRSGARQRDRTADRALPLCDRTRPHFYATGRDHILAHPRLGEAGIHHIRLTILKEYCPTSTLGERLNEHNLSRTLEFRQDVHANIFDATSLTKAKKIATQLARPNINTRQLNRTPSVRSTIGHKNSVTTLLYAAIVQKSRKVRAEVSIVTDILRADRREDDRRAGATTPDRRQAAQSHERQEHGGIPSGTITAYRLPALVPQKPS